MVAQIIIIIHVDLGINNIFKNVFFHTSNYVVLNTITVTDALIIDQKHVLKSP